MKIRVGGRVAFDFTVEFPGLRTCTGRVEFELEDNALPVIDGFEVWAGKHLSWEEAITPLKMMALKMQEVEWPGQGELRLEHLPPDPADLLDLTAPAEELEEP